MTSIELSERLPARRALFRAAAVERMASPERLDIAASVVRPAAWLLLLVCVVVAAATVAAGILIRIPIKVHAEGLLINAAGVKEVAATSGGQIKSLSAVVGQHIDAGTVVARLEQPDLRQDLETASAELRDAQEQLQKITEFQARTQSSQGEYRAQQRKNLQNSIGFGEQRVSWLSDRLRGFEDLASRGIVTKQKLLDARVELGQANEELARNRSALKQLDVEEETQRSERERERLNLELKVSTAGRKVAMLNERMGRIDAVTSPYSGRVAEIKMNEGELVERGGALMTIVPDDTSDPGETAPLIAMLYVPADEGKKIQVGMKTEVVPTTVKRDEVGFIRAKVTAVSDAPVTLEGMVRILKNRQLAQSLSSGGAPFEVRAELEPSAKTPTGLEWSSSLGPDQPLSGNSPCKGEVIVRDEPVLQLLIPATRPFFEYFKL